MRFLFKLCFKLALVGAVMLAMIAGLKFGKQYFLPDAGTITKSEVEFSREESGLMSAFFGGAVRFLTGSASRDEIAGEISDQLLAGRSESEMGELGIEYARPDKAEESPSDREARPVVAAAPAAGKASRIDGALAQLNGAPGTHVPALESGHSNVLARLADTGRENWMELTVVPVVLVGFMVVRRLRKGPAGPDYVPQEMTMQAPVKTDAAQLKHDVYSLNPEQFETLVALVYQRQGYRVSMPAALSGGKGGDFLLQRKSERILVQCKKMSLEHEVPVERVQELQAAVEETGATRGLFVACCDFSWDARYFAKNKGLSLINGFTLDQLISDTKQNAEEDLLRFGGWVAKFSSKLHFTAPECPSCGAVMDRITANGGESWLCSQRPDCRGRRIARKLHPALQIEA